MKYSVWKGLMVVDVYTHSNNGFCSYIVDSGFPQKKKSSGCSLKNINLAREQLNPYTAA